MKVLIFVHDLVFGGTSVNAIELAAALRDSHGFEVVLFATPGPMVRVAKQKGLRFLPAPFAATHPSPGRMRALRDAVHSERPDLIYVWETWSCVDAYYAVHVPMRLPMVLTDMQMHLTRLLPKSLPVTFGTPELVDRARAAGHRKAVLLLPPVDVHENAPDAVDPAPFRKRHGVKAGDITLVTVSRLVESMKGESLFRTLDAVRQLGSELPLRWLIVGDGPARPQLQRLAEEINSDLGRSAVVLTGALLDPRPAYAAADVVIGMGGSALRGMAFGKPVLIVGVDGFSASLRSETAEHFCYKGIYGRGDGDQGNAGLVAEIRALAEQPDRLPILGAFSRQFVLRSFSLEVVSAGLADFLRVSADEAPRLHIAAADGVRTAAVYLRERRFLWRSPPPGPVELVDG